MKNKMNVSFASVALLSTAPNVSAPPPVAPGGGAETCGAGSSPNRRNFVPGLLCNLKPKT